MSVLPKMEGGARMRWLLLGSLALNLFFVGAAGAVAFRYTSPVPLATVARIDRSLPSRFDRIATSLPPADAAVPAENCDRPPSPLPFQAAAPATRTPPS